MLKILGKILMMLLKKKQWVIRNCNFNEAPDKPFNKSNVSIDFFKLINKKNSQVFFPENFPPQRSHYL